MERKDEQSEPGLTNHVLAGVPQCRLRVVQNANNGRFDVLQHLLPVAGQHIDHVVVHVLRILNHRQVQVLDEFVY